LGTTSLLVGATFTGGAGAESVLMAATTKANTLGDGNDTVTLSVAALGTGGSIDAGDGTADVLSMTAANAITATATGTFEGTVSNFERLNVAAVGASGTINMSNMDDISYIDVAGVAPVNCSR
jgi:S-layer protein